MPSSSSEVSEAVSDSVSEGEPESPDFAHPADAKITAHTRPAAANCLNVFI